MTWDWILIFLYSAVIDTGAVLYTRSVQFSRVTTGAVTTATLALLNWLSILLVTKHDDMLIIPSIIGHVSGFIVGMVLPVRPPAEPVVCQRCHPTTGPGHRSSDPS